MLVCLLFKHLFHSVLGGGYFCFQKSCHVGRAQSTWVDMCSWPRDFQDPQPTQLFPGSVCGRRGAEWHRGQRGGWRSSSLKAEPAPLWLRTSELDPSFQESHWMVGAYSWHIKGRSFPSKISFSLASLAEPSSFSCPFQQDTYTPFKQGAMSGPSWWTVALKLIYSLTGFPKVQLRSGPPPPLASSSKQI